MQIKNIKDIGFSQGVVREASKGIVKIIPIWKRIFKFLNMPHAEPGCCESDLTYLPVGYNKIDDVAVYYDPETDQKVEFSTGGGGDQDNIMQVTQVSLTDLGLDETATDEDVRVALAAYVDGMVIPEDVIPHFQVTGFPDSGGGEAMRFGVAGEDDSANEARIFNVGNYGFGITTNLIDDDNNSTLGIFEDIIQITRNVNNQMHKFDMVDNYMNLNSYYNISDEEQIGERITFSREVGLELSVSNNFGKASTIIFETPELTGESDLRIQTTGYIRLNPALGTTESAYDKTTADLTDNLPLVMSAVDGKVYGYTGSLGGGNAIPITGTDGVSGPVTGDVEFDENERNIFAQNPNYFVNFQLVAQDGVSALYSYNNITGESAAIQASSQDNDFGNGIQVIVNRPNARGLYGSNYFPNKDPNTYAQMQDIANAMSYSTTETLTGGTWIDGKPIYRIVKQYGAISSSGAYTDLFGSLETIINFSGYAEIGGNRYLLNTTGINNAFSNGIAKVDFKFRQEADTLRWDIYLIDNSGVATTPTVDGLILILEFTKSTD